MTEDDIRLLIAGEPRYGNKKAVVYAAVLPDGRKAKVRLAGDKVIDAFTHH